MRHLPGASEPCRAPRRPASRPCFWGLRVGPFLGPVFGPGIGGQKCEGRLSALTFLSADSGAGMWAQNGARFRSQKIPRCGTSWWTCKSPPLRECPTCTGDLWDGPGGVSGHLGIRAAKPVSGSIRPPSCVPGEMHARFVVQRMRSGGPGPRCMWQAYRAGKHIVCVTRGGSLKGLQSRRC